MKTLTILFAVITLALAIGATGGETVVIPAHTVIPVALETTLNSAANRVGDRFLTHCSQPNCGGFPANTTFLGRITDLTPASPGVPGQIGVSFYQALLADGTKIDLTGGLSSLDQHEVATDPNTGRIYKRPEARRERGKFIAYGAGAGALIGVIGSHKKTKGAIEGALIGGLTGWIVGSAVKPKQVYKDVNLPPGTTFGIELLEDVRLTPTLAAGGSGAGPGEVLNVTFEDSQPFTGSDGVLMVPLRRVLDGIGMPLVYSASTDTVSIGTSRGPAKHTISTNILVLGDSTVTLSSSSRLVDNVTYVPVDFIAVVTGKQVSWDPDAGALTLH